MIDKSSENIIKYLSGKYTKLLPSGSLHTYNDLRQWGMIICDKCKKMYDPNRGVLFTTFLYKNLLMKFNVILKYERAKKRNKEFPVAKKRVRRSNKDRMNTAEWKTYSHRAVYGNEAEYKMANVIDEADNPERMAMFNEAVNKIAEVNGGFADMIRNGVPDGLMKIAKRENRIKRRKSDKNAIDGNIKITKRMIEIYFNINLKEIERLFYNYYDNKIA